MLDSLQNRNRAKNVFTVWRILRSLSDESLLGRGTVAGSGFFSGPVLEIAGSVATEKTVEKA